MVTAKKKKKQQQQQQQKTGKRSKVPNKRGRGEVAGEIMKMFFTSRVVTVDQVRAKIGLTPGHTSVVLSELSSRGFIRRKSMGVYEIKPRATS